MGTRIKKTTFVFAIILLTCVQVQAQRNRNHSSNRELEYAQHNYNRYHSNHDSYNHHSCKNAHCSRTYCDHGRYYNSYYRGNYGPPPWAFHHHPRHTRYVYFRDYGVYYDYHRNTYVTISGRNWSVSTSLPQPMYRANVNNIVYEEIDYPGDNVYEYHAHRYYAQR